MRRTGLARGQGMKLAVSSAPKARKAFKSHTHAGRRTLLGVQVAHCPCAKWSFWWVSFREHKWVTSRERRSQLIGGALVVLAAAVVLTAGQLIGGALLLLFALFLLLPVLILPGPLQRLLLLK